jgi:hypothetical protein
MAGQLDIYKLRGTMGNLPFTNRKTDIWFVKKTGIDANRIATDPKNFKDP